MSLRSFFPAPHAAVLRGSGPVQTDRAIGLKPEQPEPTAVAPRCTHLTTALPRPFF